MCYKEKEWKALLHNRRVLIAGYGREGRSSERFLGRFLPSHCICVADGNEAIRQLAGQYDIIIKSPGIPMSVFAGACPLEKISSQTDLFLQLYAPQTIGITGTKGKSTTTELIYQMLSQNTPVGLSSQYSKVLKAGNMGIPLFDIIDQLDETTLVVAELSCHQLEKIHRSPHIAVILNFFQEHLDHYRDYEDYQQAKLNIFRYQSKNDFGYYCDDNDTLRRAIQACGSSIQSSLKPYSVNPPFACCPSPSLQGKHNLSNIKVAALVSASLGTSSETIQDVIRHFNGLPYRMAFVGKYDGIRFYDDSISTIPEAAIAAIEALGDVDTIIIGGFDRGIVYDDLVRYLASSTVNNIVFVGAAGRRILSLYRALCPELSDHRSCLVEDDYNRIVPWCFSHTAKDHSCLLSPAAASYDAFKNFEERGKVFDQLVHNIGLRHQLHAHPCLSGHEESTHDTIVNRLRDYHPSTLFEHVGGYGIVAFWGDSAKPCVAFRADIDALPIQESDVLSYHSDTQGVSHKCGHDGHTTILLRMAEMIASEKLQQVLLIFQPEEETGMGSQKILDSGILQQFKIDKIFAIHNLPGYPLNQVVLSRGSFAAASSGVVYHLLGRQTHASTPEKGINPGLCVSEIISELHSLNTHPDAPSEVFQQSTLICVRLGDEAFGTSAGEAEMMFTLRAYTNERMKSLMAAAAKIVKSAAVRHGLTWSSKQREPFLATENHSSVVENLYKAMIHWDFSVQLKSTPFRWSEDFANYLQHYQGCMFGIGAGTDCAELHHPQYDFPDEIIEPTASLFIRIVRLWQSGAMN